MGGGGHIACIYLGDEERNAWTPNRGGGSVLHTRPIAIKLRRPVPPLTPGMICPLLPHCAPPHLVDTDSIAPSSSEHTRRHGGGAQVLV